VTVGQLGLFDGEPTIVGVQRSAVFSPCGNYRYSLTRAWDDTKPRVCFLMQNPSVADDREDDPTVKKCIGFARRWGFGSIVVVNIRAFVATDPTDVGCAAARGMDTVGPDNARYVRDAISQCMSLVVACGGDESMLDAARETLAGCDVAAEISCIGYTKDDVPKHPSRLGYSTPREPFRVWPEEITGPGAWAMAANGGWQRLGEAMVVPIRVAADEWHAGAHVRKPSDAWFAVGRRR
jgi:hypothetical protein